MHTAVLLGLDKSASFQVAAFEPEDIDYWLNEAQLELVKRKLYGNNYRQEWYEDSVKRMEDLTPLLRNEVAGAFGTHPIYPNVDTIDTAALTGDYMFYVNISCKNTAQSLLDEAILIKSSEIKNLVETSRNKPYLKNPYVFLQDNDINIIRDPFRTYDEYSVFYVVKPAVLVRTSPGPGQVTTSELPEQVHPEIVALAVYLMLENIEAERQQTNLITLNNKE